MPYSDVLKTIAEVAATLAGFIGVVFVLGRRSERPLSSKERSALFHLLFTSVGALFLSLGQVVALEATRDSVWEWRIANAIAGVYHLIGLLKATAEVRRGVHGLVPVLGHPLKAGSYLIITGQFLVLAGFGTRHAPLLFVVAMIWLLLVSVGSFVSMLASPRAAE